MAWVKSTHIQSALAQAVVLRLETRRRLHVMGYDDAQQGLWVLTAFTCTSMKPQGREPGPCSCRVQPPPWVHSKYHSKVFSLPLGPGMNAVP